MALLFIENSLTPEQFQRLKTYPYSVDLSDQKYSYELTYYGLEHLNPKALVQELVLGRETCLNLWGIHSNPKENYLFKIPLKDQVFDLFELYENFNVLKVYFFKDESFLYVSKIDPLRKLKKGPNPEKVATLILDYVLFLNQVPYESTHGLNKFETFLLKELNPLEIKKFELIYGLLKESYTIPGFLLYFNHLEESLGYELQLKNPCPSGLTYKIQVDKNLKEQSFYSIFSLLKSLNLKEFLFLHIGECSCSKLLNPLSSKYSSYCTNPFFCKLKDKKLPKEGYACIKGTLYIWSNKLDLKKYLKTGLELFEGLSMGLRHQKETFLYKGTLKKGVLRNFKDSYYFELFLD